MDDNWHGAYYELAMELGEADDDRLDRALRAVWASAGVRGCYARRDLEPPDQTPVACTVKALTAHGHLHGLVGLPSGTEIVCGVVAVREDHGSDWLDFYLPAGALSRAEPRFSGSDAFGPDEAIASLSWRRPIDEWLALVAGMVYDKVAFRLALIGFEASGMVYASQFAEGNALPPGWAYLIPDGAHVRYVPARC